MLGGLVASVVVLFTLTYLVVRATDRGWDGVVDTLWRPRTLELIGRSLNLAVTVTALCLAIGITGAWIVTRTNVPFRRFWTVVLALPLAMPSYVAAWAWVGYRPDLAGFGGATLVLTSVAYPYVYLPVLAALRRTDPALEEVASAEQLCGLPRRGRPRIEVRPGPHQGPHDGVLALEDRPSDG